MNVALADLVQQYHSIRADVDAAIRDVLESGQFILGPRVEQLEAQIASFCGSAYAVAVNSGTDALLLSLVALGIGPGDEVITTPFTFVATVEAITQVGAIPVFADIDPATFNLSAACAAACITSRTRAIMPVDLFGQMADREAFTRLARASGLHVIWDSAQAIGSTWDGAPVGMFGDAATLSFFPTKNLGAFGDAGMVLTNDKDVSDRLRKLRFHGSGGGYEYAAVGYCSRLDALQAAILSVKLRRLDEWTAARRCNAEHYANGLAGTRCVLPFSRPEAGHTYHQYTVRHPDRDRLRAYLAEHGVDSGVYYPKALHLQEAYRTLGYAPGDLPESERATAEVLSLPVHPGLTREQVEHVCAMVRAFDGLEAVSTPPS